MSFLAADAISVEMLGRLGRRDELDVQEAIGELLRLSLVDREGRPVRVHRLVQDVVRVGLARRRRRTGWPRDAAARSAWHGRRGRRDVPDDVAAHLVAGRGALRGAAARAAGPGRRAGRRGPPLRRAGPVPRRRAGARAALRLAGVQSGGAGTTIQRGTLLCQLGEVLDAAGRLDEALDLHRHAVELLDGEPEADELVLAHAYNRLGHVLNCADDTASAIAAHERSLKTLRAVQRDDLVAPVLVDLGYTLWADGLLDAAEEALSAGRELLEERASTSGAGRTPRPGSAWWPRTTAGSRRRSPTSAAIEVFTESRRGPPRHRAGDGQARLRPAPAREVPEAIEQHQRAVRCSNGCSGRRTPGSR